MTPAALAQTSGWLLYRADGIQERDELANLGPVTNVSWSGTGGQLIGDPLARPA